jgi:uncharacterized protein
LECNNNKMNLQPLALIGIATIACIVAWLPLAIGLGWRPGKAITLPEKLKLVVSLYLVIPPVLWGMAVWQGWNFGDYGLRLDLLTLLAGWSLGVGGLGILFGSELALGWAVVKSTNIRKDLLPILVLSLWIGAVEELLFRGFFVNVLSPYGIWEAALLGSVLFALLHLVWEPASDFGRALPQLPGLVLMGLVLIYARTLAGGNLNLAWGMHAGWVWVITLIDTHSLIAYTERVPTWVTGLDGKPLAGLLGWLFLGTTVVALWGIHRWFPAL